MTPHPTPRPPTFGLFDKRVEGDDCLLELARLRFQQAALGAEMHAGTPEQFEGVLRFRPSPVSPVVVHLARELNLMEERSQDRVLEFASRFAGRVHGLVLHDHLDLVNRPKDYCRAARRLEDRLQRIESAPLVFVENAAGVEFGAFTRFLESIGMLSHVSACLDIGHAGIWQARRAYSRLHPGTDICALRNQISTLRHLMADVQAAVESVLPAVLDLVEALGAPAKPVHFHLHDGHPLSRFSSFGVSDHLSFLAELPLDFDFRGRQVAPFMFGPAGLGRIVTKAIESMNPDRVSFTLEIHPTGDRLALADAAGLFAHWRDKTHAEIMNHWLSVLAENHRVLLESLSAALDHGALVS
jgi:hypothetical protein